jgi:hypothetical protein
VVLMLLGKERSNPAETIKCSKIRPTFYFSRGFFLARFVQYLKDLAGVGTVFFLLFFDLI